MASSVNVWSQQSIIVLCIIPNQHILVNNSISNFLPTHTAYFNQKGNTMLIHILILNSKIMRKALPSRRKSQQKNRALQNEPEQVPWPGQDLQALVKELHRTKQQHLHQGSKQNLQ